MGDATIPVETVFPVDRVPHAAKDVLYELVDAYVADTSDQKVDLSVGAYKDENAKPWILPVVKKANEILYNDLNPGHEYLPIAGLPEFTSAAQRVVLGSESPAIRDGRVCTFQAISGTGALHLGGQLLSKFLLQPTPSIYMSSPTWPAHPQCFTNVGMSIEHYPYFSSKTKMVDFDGMISTVSSAPRGSIVLLHVCAHNPTGVDLSEEQWKEVAQVMRAKGLFPFFDCAYQGFASGSLRKDNFAIRYFVEQGMELVIAQSFAKNMGLYGQRVGAFHYVASPGPNARDAVQRVASQLAIIQRSEISSPPLYGAQIAAIILNDEQLFAGWEHDLTTMSGRIIETREVLKQELVRLQTPGNWDHITSQIGMFSFSGLSAAQVLEMRNKWHVYMLSNGRMSVTGLNKHNVKYFAEAVDDVVRRIRSD